MKVNLNTNVFAIHTREDGTNYIDMTEDLTELDSVVSTLVKVWEGVKARNNACMVCDREALGNARDSVCALTQEIERTAVK